MAHAVNRPQLCQTARWSPVTLPRTEFRSATAAALTGATAAEGRVTQNRVRPYQAKVLAAEGPVLSVYSKREVETFGGEDQSSCECELDIIVGVALVADTDEGLDDALDELCGQVVDTLMSGPWRLQFRKVTRIVTDKDQAEDGDYLVGLGAVTFTVVYNAHYSAPDGDRFSELRLEADVRDRAHPAGDGVIETETTITLGEP